MKFRLLVATVALVTIVSSTVASAATSLGPVALALAALVSPVSPQLASGKKHELAALLGGDSQGPWSGGPIVVRATKIVCRSSNVDITSRSCTLTFGMTNRTMAGRLANELTASLLQAGARGQGAAGTNDVGVTSLSCTVAPAVIRQRAGGGASCSFTDM